MTQRRLLFTALAIVMTVGLLFIGNAAPEASKKKDKIDIAKCQQKGSYYRSNKSKCNRAIAGLPSPTPVATPTPSVKPDPNVSPTPPADGDINVKLAQRTWQKAEALSSPVVFSTLPDATAQKDCNEVNSANLRSVEWNKYLRSEKIEVNNSNLVSRLKNKLDNTYLISNVFSINEEATGNLKQMAILVQYEGEASFRLFYRVSDQPAVADEGWTQLGSADIAKKEKCGKDFVYLYNVNKPAKYFQYKVQLVPNKVTFLSRAQRIRRVSLFAYDPVRAVDVIPNPNPDPKISPSPDPDPSGEGKLQLSTRRIIPARTTDASPSPSPSSSALLPTNSPKPLPSPTQKPYTCASTDYAEPVANISLSIKQLTDGGKPGKEILDQQTDEDGLWTGIDGNEDTFPSGNYRVTFGPYSDQTYRLVAFCDPDNDNIINTQSNEKDRQATVKVKPNATTRLIALYAPSSNPYLAMKKYALPTANGLFSGPQRDLKLVYPGQSFTYYISYENTGGQIAKQVVIRDVIPGQFSVNEDALLKLHSDAELSIDIRGGTLVTIPLADLPAGAKGGVKIPVTLKADAFTDSAQAGIDDSAQNLNLN